MYALGRPPPIIAMVVCWGPQIEPIPTAVSRIRPSDRDYGDVRVVSGYQAGEWLPLLTGLSAGIAVACTATLVAAVFSRPVLHFLVRMDRLGGGTGAAAYVLLPLGLPVCSAVVAYRVRTRARAARLDAPSTAVIASRAAAITWTAAVAAVSAFT